MLLSSSPDECRHISKRLSDGEVRLEAALAAAENEAKYEVSHFCCALALLLKYCVRNHIAHVRTSVNKRSSTVMEILRSLHRNRQNIVFGQSFLGIDLLGFDCVPPSRDVLLLSRICVAPESNCLAVPASTEIQVTSLSRYKKEPKIPPNLSTELCKTYTMRTPFDDA